MMAVMLAAMIPGPYVVYFAHDSAEIAPHMVPVVDNIAQGLLLSTGTEIRLNGHADRSGPEGHNRALSARRAETVRRELVRRGVAEACLRTEAFGESDPAVDTEDGEREPNNRRVEILFAPATRC